MQLEPKEFYFNTQAARKIIVVDLGFLGDSVHLVPALWEIKRHYPQAELHVLSAPVGREVIALAPCVDHPWAFPLGPQSPPWWRHWNVIRALRRQQFDLAFNFSGADRTIFLTALTGAKWRLAHQGARKHFWSPWLIPNWVPPRSREAPVFEQRRQVLAAAGFSLEPPRFDLRLDEPSQRWAEEKIPAGSVHFSINASTHLKEWPLELSIELAKIMLREQPALRLLATGSSQPREQSRLQTLAATVDDARLQILTGLSIRQLAATLARCRLHIGADSGVLHLAMAMGVPTLAIFREYAGTREWLPSGEKHAHLTVPCPCADQKDPPCQNLNQACCLAQITPEQVARVIRENLRLAGSI